MELKVFIEGCFEQQYNSMLRAVEGLTNEEMAWTPHDQCSSIAFLLWHYGRTLDRWIHTRIKGDAQLWENTDWAEILGRAPARGDDTGYGFTAKDLQSLVCLIPGRCWHTWQPFGERASNTSSH